MSVPAPEPSDRNGHFVREVFETSRKLEYCSQKELEAQTGYDRPHWPAYVVHELFDNALDACEDVGTLPEIHLRVDEHSLEVTDNGPGIPPETVTRLLDFDSRISSREVYVSPCRGAQGNALKTLVTMPFVLDGSVGVIEVTARGIRHIIRVRVDRIAQQPVVAHEKNPVADAPGTTVRIHWPAAAAEELAEAAGQMACLAEDYTFFNPHLSLQIDCFEHHARVERLRSDWNKWMPKQPPNAHWYELDDFRRHLGACIAKDRADGADRTVRAFVAGFAGLSASAKQTAVLDGAGMKRMNLSELVRDGDIAPEPARLLLGHMKQQSKQMKPVDLGLIGRDHFFQRLSSLQCQMESFRYDKAPKGIRTPLAVPWLAETAFAWDPERSGRRLILGVNWSPCILNPFRNMGSDAVSRAAGGLESLLAEQWVRREDPVVFVLHVASARVRYTDRGKTVLAMAG